MEVNDPSYRTSDPRNPPSEEKQKDLKFRAEFVQLVDKLHPNGRPKNQDGETYTDGMIFC